MNKPKYSIRWIGKKTLDSSNGQVNWQICEELSKLGHRIILVDNENDLQKIDFVVHHDLTSDFSKLPSPPHPHTIAFRTWDFGPYPPSWVEKINKEYRRLWVYSEWTKQQALKSGIDQGKVDTISLGIEPEVFHPQGAHDFDLNTEKRFRFLFMGAAVHRKGIDILLSAYRLAFSPRDDVCLVIKDFLGGPFYQNAYEQKAIDEFRANQSNPELVYLGAQYQPSELARLIRTCDFGVFPYRAEGFAVPVIELMACGIPCIVPHFGPCLDYCSKANAVFADHIEIDLPIRRKFTYNSMGFEEWIDEVHICEVKVEDLAQKMRIVYEMDPREYQTLSDNAAKSVQKLTWQNTARVIEKTLNEMA